LTEVGAGQIIYELRRKIQNLTMELNQLGKETPEIPELIQSANLMRKNDHLVEVNAKNSELISAYEEYSKELEKMLSMVFEIQKDLKEILKTQSSLISEPKSKTKSKRKPSKK
jgi:chromosome segregation ATPase